MKPEHFIGIGMLIIFIGFVVIFLGLVPGKAAEPKTKVAVGGFIGFIPFGFGNDKRLAWFVMASSLVLFLVWLLFIFRLRA